MAIFKLWEETPPMPKVTRYLGNRKGKSRMRNEKLIKRALAKVEVIDNRVVRKGWSGEQPNHPSSNERVL